MYEPSDKYIENHNLKDLLYSWSFDTHTLADSEPRKLYTELPIMHLDPMADRQYTQSDIYRCPVYKTLLRAGMLSTTGHYHPKYQQNKLDIVYRLLMYHR